MVKLSDDSKVLDYGCGKGYFIDYLKNSSGCEVIGYDKYMENEHPLISDAYEAVDKENYYDFVTCFETLEHCHVPQQDIIIERAEKALKKGGHFLVSVPIEIGPMSIIKNILRYRTLRRFQEYNLWNIIKAGMFLPPKSFRDQFDYPGHFGWDHRDLEKKLSALSSFRMAKKKYSPFAIPTILINSQVFYLLEKIEKT